MFRIVAAMLWAIPLLAADPACQQLIDAGNKLYTVPVHLYKTETSAMSGGKPRLGESIFLNDKTYIMVGGKWKLSPVSPQQLRAARKDADTTGASCKRLGDDTVNGEPAIIVGLHQKTDDDTIDSKTWISKSRGLPLQSEVDIDVGGGAAGKSHSLTRYEYTNVQPPPNM